MESDDIKMCKMQARKVAQDVLMFVWFKNEVIPVEPKPELSFVPEITAKFLNNLCVLVWMESSRNEYVWGDFLKNHFERMTTTPYLFANYFAYASYILIEKATDPHACFIDILSLVIHFSLCCRQKKDKFLNSCVDLFCAFFDKELCSKFEDEGRWQNFDEYLENQRKPYVINDVVLKDITEYQVESHKKALFFANLVGDKMKEVCNKAFEEVLKDFLKTENQVEELYRIMAGVASGGMASAKDQSLSQEGTSENPNKNKDQSKEVKGLTTFKKVLKERYYSQEEEKTVGVASGEMTSSGDQSSSQEVQEEALENVPSKTNPGEIENRMKEGNASDPLETQGINSLKSRDLSPAPKESDLSPKLTKVERAKTLLKEMMIDIAKISELIKFVCEENAIKVPIQVVDTVSKL